MHRKVILPWILAVAPATALVFEACSTAYSDAENGTDAGSSDARASTDATARPDAPPEVDANIVITYAPTLSDPSAWSSIDVSTFVGDTNGGFHSGVLDGTYLYLVPAAGSNFARYDTTKPLTTTTAWRSYDLQEPDLEWIGAAFDGRYVVASPYGGPNMGSTPGYSNLVVRYDTTKDFDDDAGAWFSESLAKSGFSGVGRAASHLYFSPSNATDSTNIAVYTNLSSTAEVDLYSTGMTGEGFNGGVFANGAYYFAPAFYTGKPLLSAGQVIRVNESGDAGMAGISLDAFDYSSAQNDITARGYSGAVFDGEYVYFVPCYDYSSGQYHGDVLRFDTTGSFSDVAAWEVFSIPTILNAPTAVGFSGGAFDGRYVYFAPNLRDASEVNSFLVRYDTTKPFAEPTSWEDYDLTALLVSAGGYQGALFDGEYIYFIPMMSTVLMRFDARTPKVAPSGFPGSP